MADIQEVVLMEIPVKVPVGIKVGVEVGIKEVMPQQVEGDGTKEGVTIPVAREAGIKEHTARGAEVVGTKVVMVQEGDLGAVVVVLGGKKVKPLEDMEQVRVGIKGKVVAHGTKDNPVQAMEGRTDLLEVALTKVEDYMEVKAGIKDHQADGLITVTVEEAGMEGEGMQQVLEEEVVGQIRDQEAVTKDLQEEGMAREDGQTKVLVVGVLEDHGVHL